MSDTPVNAGVDTRCTKIVCTLGPATDEPGVLEQIAREGMDVARFNFSHQDHEQHLGRLNQLRAVSARLGRPIATMADLQGPKIRVRRFRDGSVTLTRGSRFTLTANPVEGDATIVSTTWPSLPREVKPQETILLHDGLLRLRVVDVSGLDVHCEVLVGGPLSNNQGINLPESSITTSPITEKDRRDLEFILAQGFDFVALSFVRCAGDIVELKKLMSKLSSPPLVVAKIERPEAVVQFSEIVKEIDVAMVARGDLGVELAPEKVPLIQKRIIRECLQAGKPVITATEMLESMTENSRPTRAEASDVANAVEDGTDAVMLSGETAKGRHPVEAVAMMARLCREVDPQITRSSRARFERLTGPGVSEAIAHAAAESASDLGAKLIVSYTASGHTAALVAKYRPWTRLVALCPRASVSRRLCLTWGVHAFEVPHLTSLDDLPPQIDQLCAKHGLARQGDLVAITAGAPLGGGGITNFLRIYEVGSLV